MVLWKSQNLTSDQPYASWMPAKNSLGARSKNILEWISGRANVFAAKGLINTFCLGRAPPPGARGRGFVLNNFRASPRSGCPVWSRLFLICLYLHFGPIIFRFESGQAHTDSTASILKLAASRKCKFKQSVQLARVIWSVVYPTALLDFFWIVQCF